MGACHLQWWGLQLEEEEEEGMPQEEEPLPCLCQEACHTCHLPEILPGRRRLEAGQLPPPPEMTVKACHLPATCHLPACHPHLQWVPPCHPLPYLGRRRSVVYPPHNIPPWDLTG